MVWIDRRKDSHNARQQGREQVGERKQDATKKDTRLRAIVKSYMYGVRVRTAREDREEWRVREGVITVWYCMST
jgi:hypothetical protein